MHSTASPDQMLRKKRSATPGLGSGHSETETGKGSRQMNKQCLSDSQDNTKRSEVETPDVTEVGMKGDVNTRCFGEKNDSAQWPHSRSYSIKSIYPQAAPRDLKVEEQQSGSGYFAINTVWLALISFLGDHSCILCLNFWSALRIYL